MNDKYSSIVKLSLCFILGIVLFVGCGENKNLPKINELIYQEANNRLIVNASDESGIEAYLITLTLDKPQLDDSNWQQSSVFEDFTESGNYIVWVKNKNNDLAKSEIKITIYDTNSLSKEYEFLQWYLDDSTTKIVDGNTYDLVALKNQFGDLYRFIEPLSEEETEYRFEYLAEFLEQQSPDDVDSFGLKSSSEDEHIGFEISTKLYNYYKILMDGVYPEFIKYSDRYYYLEKTGKYYKELPDSFKINDEFSQENLIKLIDSISYTDKDWYIRDYMFRLELTLNTYKDLGSQPEFGISLSKP